jgi:WD40 repeat protein
VLHWPDQPLGVQSAEMGPGAKRKWWFRLGLEKRIQCRWTTLGLQRPRDRLPHGQQQSARKNVRDDKLVADIANASYPLTFSPTGKRLIYTHYTPNPNFFKDYNLHVNLEMVDLADPQLTPRRLTGVLGYVLSIEFSPDGKRLAVSSCPTQEDSTACGKNITIMVLDASTGKPVLGPLGGQDGYGGSLAFTPNGKFLATLGSSDTLWLRDARTGQPVHKITDFVGPLTCMAFSPDSKLVAGGRRDHRLQFWDIQTGQPSGPSIEGPDDWITSTAFSADGKPFYFSISIGSGRGGVWILDVETRQFIGTTAKGFYSAANLSLSPDSRYLAIGSSSGLELWSVALNDCIAQACRIANCNLTLVEWERYVGSGGTYHKTCP